MLALDHGPAIDRHRHHQSAGVVGCGRDEVDPARRADAEVTAHACSHQLQGSGETLDGIEIERRAQGDVDLIGAGLDILADAIEDLLVAYR